MSTATLASPAVTAFAAAVRDALSDLPADEVDDLTDGLEADLTERLAEHLEGADAEELGDPRAYAEELRVAAGLPLRPPARSGFIADFAALRRAPRSAARDLRALVARHPVLTRFAAFFVSLRPVWWVFRAGVVSVLFGVWSGMAPVNGFSVVFAMVALIVSVQFGRGRWLPFAWMRALLLAANVLLVVATPFVIAGWATQLNNAAYLQSYAESFPDQSSDGLTRNGNPVSNIFAYDAQGQPLTDVQLFDQDGKPLDLIADPTQQIGYVPNSNSALVPNEGVPGRLGWNVFPLAHVGPDDVTDSGTVKKNVTPDSAVAPFGTAKPLAGFDGGAPTPTPTPTAAPTAAPTVAPTP